MPTLAKAFLLGTILLSAGTAEAATILVNDSGDSLHASPGGCALTGTGVCTLRDAITFANANAGQDNILFQGTVTAEEGGTRKFDVISPANHAGGAAS